MIDFTVPGGVSSLSDLVFIGAGGITDANKELGSINRMLHQRIKLLRASKLNLNLLMVEIVVEFEVETLHIFNRRDNLENISCSSFDTVKC